MSDAALNVRGIAEVDRIYLYLERLRHGLNDAELCGAGGSISSAKDRRARHTWRDLFEQPQPLPADAVFGRQEAGGVAAGPRQAVDEPSARTVPVSV